MPFCNSLSEVHFYIPLALKIPENFIMHPYFKNSTKSPLVTQRLSFPSREFLKLFLQDQTKSPNPRHICSLHIV